MDYGSGDVTGDVTINAHNGGEDAFLIKMAGADGSVLWQKSSGGPQDDAVEALTVDWALTGDVSAVGRYETASVTGDVTISTYVDTNSNADVFLLKFDTTGAPIWQQISGGRSLDNILSVAVSGSDFPVVGGYLYFSMMGDWDVGALTAGSTDAWAGKLCR